MVTRNGYTFELTDQHGTATVSLDSTAKNPTWQQSTPYGAPRDPAPSSTWLDPNGFLGKAQSASAALTTIGARQYDTTLGRCISLDPVLEADPQQLNGYTYAGSNPITGSDPTGLYCDGCQADGGAAAASTDHVGCSEDASGGCRSEQEVRTQWRHSVHSILGHHGLGHGAIPLAPLVGYKKLQDLLNNLYARPWVTNVEGDGTTATALTYELNNGQQLVPGTWHYEKAVKTLAGLGDVLEQDRQGKISLSETDSQTVMSEAEKLWKGLQTPDRTGNVEAMVRSSPKLTESIQSLLTKIKQNYSLRSLTGQEFSQNPYSGRPSWSGGPQLPELMDTLAGDAEARSNMRNTAILQDEEGDST